MNYRDDFLDSESDDDQLKRVGKNVVRLMEIDNPITHSHTNTGALAQIVYKMMAPYIAQAIEDYAKANMPDE